MSEQENPRDKEYRIKYEDCRVLNRQKDELEEKIKIIKNDVAKMMHEDKLNEKIVNLSNGEDWHAIYQTTSRSSTDLKALMEMIGPVRYGQIVTSKSTTFLKISKAPKNKKSDDLMNSKPVDDDQPLIPEGLILS